MTIYYIDPEGGNDANPGTSFANRKRTIGSLPSLSAGDEIRYKATRAPRSLGSMTWTDNTRALTLNSAMTLEIDPCTAAWTASTNVTCSANTSRKYGATASRFVVASGFTTGKVAYRALPGTLDASGYTALSFWLNVVTAGSFGGRNLTLNLCSDATGDVPVVSVLIDFGQTANPGSNSWCPVFLDTGAPLPSNINSISLSFATDPGSTTFQLNNLFACQALDHADHLSLRSLIGKNTSGEPEWYPIGSINGTDVQLMANPSVAATPGPVYRGVTESVTTYQLIPTYPNWSSTERTTPAQSGSEASPIRHTYGWNATDMATQDGITAWTGMTYMGSLFSTAVDWHSFEGPLIIVDPLTAPWTLGSGAQFINFEIEQLSGVPSWNPAGSSSDTFWLKCDRIVWCADTTLGPGAQPFRVRIRRVTGCTQSSTTSAAVFVSTGSTTFNRFSSDVHIEQIDNCMGNGVAAASSNHGYIRGCTLFNNANADVRSSSGAITLDNCDFSTVSVNPPTADGVVVQASNIGGDSTDHKFWRKGYRGFTQTAVRQEGSGVAWEIQPVNTSFVNRMRPATLTLARVACEANEEVTVTCYCRRSNTGLTVGLRLKGGQIPGVLEDVTDVMTDGADTWQQLTLTFTPTARGVVEIDGYCHGGTTYSAFFDSLTVSQA